MNGTDIPASDLTDRQVCEYLGTDFSANRAAMRWHGGWSTVIREAVRRGLVERRGITFHLTPLGKAALRGGWADPA